MTRYYINVILFLLGQEGAGSRPCFIDDWRFYRKVGVKKWVRSGYLNASIPLIPLGWMGTFRAHIEADLLLQNVLLAIQAMGLGGWVHAAFPSRSSWGPGAREVRRGPQVPICQARI
jgi:hypothetical protein